MEISFIEIAAVLLGFLIRLGIPILLTILLAAFLKWLDRRWQAQAEMEMKEMQVLATKGQERRPCWEIHNCPENLKKHCRAYANPSIPCWEVFRTNGQLKPACKNCKIVPPDVPGRIAIAQALGD